MSVQPGFDPPRTCLRASRGRFCANTSHPPEPLPASRRSRSRPLLAASPGGPDVAHGRRPTTAAQRPPATDARRHARARPPHRQGDGAATRRRRRGGRKRKRKRPHKAAVSVYPRRPDQWSSFSSSSA
jgi:hypothetical protein